MPDRRRTIAFGPHHLHVPAFFASYRLGDHPTSGLKQLPWALTGTEAVLINAYDFTQRKYLQSLNNGWDLDSYLKVSGKPVLIDSGAYYFRKQNNIEITAEHVLQIQLKSRCDVGVVLDHPFPPEATDKARRISTTLRNTEKMIRGLAGQGAAMTVMAAIHGHTPRALRNCVERLRRLQDKYGYPLLAHVGIGSLAPLAQRGDIRLAVEVIHQVRRLLPASQIHCFSMGSALLMLLAFYAGADSVDSQSWIISAGFKLAQLPGHYVVRMGNREYRTPHHFNGAMRRFSHRMKILAETENFYVKDWSTGRRLNILDREVRKTYVAELVDLVRNEHVHNRACHNLWVYNFEVKRFRQEARRGHLEEFIESRLRGTRYSAAFAFAQSLRLKSG